MARWWFTAGPAERSCTCSPTVTHYRVDPNNHTGHAQVFEETNGSGAITKSYTVGLDVIFQGFNGFNGDTVLLYDGHG